MKPKKTITYDIPGKRYALADETERGEPTAHIVIGLPPIAEGVSDFRASLETIFAEILEICK